MLGRLYRLTLIVINIYANANDAWKHKDCQISDLLRVFSPDDLDAIASVLAFRNTTRSVQRRPILSSSFKEIDLLFGELLLKQSSEIESSLKNRTESRVADSRVSFAYRALLQMACQPHGVTIDDFLVNEEANVTYVRKGRDIFYAPVADFLRCINEQFAFRSRSRNFHFIYTNKRRSLLYLDRTLREGRIVAYDFWLDEHFCVLQAEPKPVFKSLVAQAEPMPVFKSLGQSSAQQPLVASPVNQETLSQDWVILVGIAACSIAFIGFTVVICVVCCFHHRSRGAATPGESSESDSERLTQSFMNAARKAEPPEEMRGKHMPDNFDSSEFYFRGALFIDRRQPLIMEIIKAENKDITDSTQDTDQSRTFVQFDTLRNQVYDVGDSVETRVGLLPPTSFRSPTYPGV